MPTKILAGDVTCGTRDCLTVLGGGEGLIFLRGQRPPPPWYVYEEEGISYMILHVTACAGGGGYRAANSYPPTRHSLQGKVQCMYTAQAGLSCGLSLHLALSVLVA